MRKDLLLKAAFRAAASKFTAKRTPLLVAWKLLNRCNQNCVYCDSGSLPCDELPTGRILELIGQMADAGVVMISYTGGEPLLRDDIGDILRETKRKGISCTLTTNGLLAPDRMRDVKSADRIVISFDGPEAVHDAIRGRGTHAKVLRAIDAIKREMGDVVELKCVLTSKNLESLDETLEFCHSEKLPIGFSIIQEFPFSSDSVDSLIPEREALRGAIDRIIESRKRGNRYVITSVPALEHLRKWPEDTVVPCVGGRIFCRIDSQGDMMGCGKFDETKGPVNCRDSSFAEAFAALRPAGCGQCWCDNKVDLNLIFSMNFQAAWNRIFNL